MDFVSAGKNILLLCVTVWEKIPRLNKHDNVIEWNFMKIAPPPRNEELVAPLTASEHCLHQSYCGQYNCNFLLTCHIKRQRTRNCFIFVLTLFCRTYIHTPFFSFPCQIYTNISLKLISQRCYSRYKRALAMFAYSQPDDYCICGFLSTLRVWDTISRT